LSPNVSSLRKGDLAMVTFARNFGIRQFRNDLRPASATSVRSSVPMWIAGIVASLVGVVAFVERGARLGMGTAPTPAAVASALPPSGMPPSPPPKP
jgi:hypothetical protein